MSELDPRNPLGTRYNPNYPRSYIVAHPHLLKKNPHAIDDAINDAKRAEILPDNWNLLTEGISINHMPLGVPCLASESFISGLSQM